MSKLILITEMEETGISQEDQATIAEEGIVSRFIRFDSSDDAGFHELYDLVPELLTEKRPDWVKKHYPNRFN